MPNTRWPEAFSSTNGQLEDLCNSIFQVADNGTHQRRHFRRTRVDAIKLLLLNFYVQSVVLPEGSVAIHSNRNAYLPRTIQHSIGLRYAQTKFALKALLDQNYVRVKSVGRRGTSVTTYHVADRFYQEVTAIIRTSGITSRRIRPEDLVVMRRRTPLGNEDGIRVRLEQTEEVNSTRELLIAYNRLMEPALVELEGYERPVRRTETHQLYISIDSNVPSLHGRFYGHWVQQVPKDDRARIRMGGEPVCEPDFRSTHAMLLYILAGQDYRPHSAVSNDGVHDIYGGFEFANCRGSFSQKRALAKMILNNSINTRSERGARQSVASSWNIATNDCLERHNDRTNNWDSDYPILRGREPINGLTENGVAPCVEEVLNRHSILRPHLFKDMGLKLMYWDSRIATKVIEHFTRRQEPIICNHESFICRASLRAELIEVMFESLKQVSKEYVNPNFTLPYSPEEVIKG